MKHCLTEELERVQLEEVWFTLGIQFTLDGQVLLRKQLEDLNAQRRAPVVPPPVEDNGSLQDLLAEAGLHPEHKT